MDLDPRDVGCEACGRVLFGWGEGTQNLHL